MTLTDILANNIFAKNKVRGSVGHRQRAGFVRSRGDGEHARCVRSQGMRSQGMRSQGMRSQGMRSHGMRSEGGFTLIDIMIATSVMMIGVLSLLLAMTTAIVSATNGQQQAQAKQYAQSAMESIFSARDINNPAIAGFSNIQNDSTSGGIFVSGFQPIYNSTGCDGIIGTADDGYGVDCTNHTADDATAIGGFKRQIVITPLAFNSQGVPTLLQITVTVSYQTNNQTLNQSLTSFMGNYNTQQIAGAVPSPTP